MKIKSTQQTITRNILAVAIVGVLFTPCVAQAGTDTWICVNDYWQNSSCWSNGLIPTSADDVVVNPRYSYSLGYMDTTLNINSGSGSVFAHDLIVDSTNTAKVSVQQTGGSLNTYLYVGFSGTGIYTLTGGSVTGHLDLGFNSGSYGTFNMGGSSSLSTNSESIGDAGSGSFIQSGGANVVSGNFLVAFDTAGSSGSYVLDAGSLSAFNEAIGERGNGVFIQRGGKNTVSNSFVLGDLSTGYGKYILSGGTLTVNSIVSGQGVGSTFNLDGGILNFSTSIAVDNFNVGNAAGSNGSFILGTGQSLSASYENVGVQGTGTITQNGGTNTISGDMTIGSNGGIGIYDLQGGSLSTTGIFNGSGASALIIDGGTLNVDNGNGYIDVGNLALGFTAGSSGSYTLSGSGGVNVTNMLVGYKGAGLFSQYDGSVFANNLTVNDTYDYYGGSLTANTMVNNGTFAFTGGDITGTGSLTNNGGMSGYGTISSSGGFINNALFTQSGGNVTLDNTAINTNYGNMDLESGRQLKLPGATFNNAGTLNLNSALVTGSGSMANLVGGTIAGRGSITTGFKNGGTIAVTGGSLNISQAFNNSGVIDITDATATMTGGSIANSGTIQGAGNVGNTINNTGTIGGTLNLSGTVTNQSGGTIDAVGGTLNLSGLVTNKVGGTIRSSAGTKVLAVNGMAPNSGLIIMAGGAFDTNGHAQTNDGNITGYGVLSTGGLTNNAKMTFSGGTATVNGAVTNATTGTINVSYSPAVFTGAVVNNGTIKTTSTTITFAGGFTENGTYISDPSSNYFTNLTIGANGILTGGVGDNFIISGNFINNSLQNTLWNTATASLSLNGSGTQDVYLAGADLGAKGIGYRNNFAWGNFSLAKGDSMNLFDGNSDPTAALYVGSFSLGGGLAQLNDITSNYNIYYNPKLNGYLKDQAYPLKGSGFLIPISSVPLPASAWLFASGLLGLVAVARRKKA